MAAVQRAVAYACLALCFSLASVQAPPTISLNSAFAHGLPPRRAPSVAVAGPAGRCRTRRRTSTVETDVAKPRNRTPLWTLKVTQMLLFAANVCLIRFITVYYHDLGLSRKLMGILLVLMPTMSFLGGLFWSVIVDRSGSYRGVLTTTSLLGVTTIFGYLLPQAATSLPLLVLITLLHGFFTAPAGPIVDGLCLKVLSEQKVPKEAYGDQRLWSAVGWGAMALVAGKLVDIYGTKCIFFCYAILVGLNVLVIQLFIHDSDEGPVRKETQVSLRQWLQTLLKFEPMWMLTNLLIYGVLVALIENFLNVFIVQDFDHAPKVILGAATAVMCAFEIPVFKYISKLWTERGYSLVAVLGFSELVMALRCFLYGIIPRNRPWLVLLVEPLHGFTFAAAWCATVTYASRLALPGTEAKMQALINGLNFNVAFAVGSLVWGCASQNPPAGLGFTRCFFLDAALTAGWLAIWASGFAAARYISARRTHR